MSQLANPFADLRQFRVVIDDHIAVVTMDNPPVNAQARVFHEEAMLVFDTLSDLDECRVVVLTGAGKCFSAGADIKGRAGRQPAAGDAWQHNRRARECFHSITECRKPVIAAINGVALGAGLAIAAACDILVAAEEAALGLPEIDVGLLGGGRHAMRLFGHSRVRRMMLTGLRVSGAELYRLGVVEACVPQARLMETALDIAREIASKSPIAVKLAKHALNAIEEMSLRDGYRFEQNMTAELGRYEDSREAMLAFAEKRKPVFTGK
jgi:enoyl-CoA hydratase/carnithine racemase